VDAETTLLLLFGAAVLFVVFSTRVKALRPYRDILRGLLLAAAVVGGLAWYFLVYDTAEGKCNRGDLGACAVVAAQHAQR
jgi:hypothetical protein